MLKAFTYIPQEGAKLDLSTFAFPSNKREDFFCKDILVEMQLLGENDKPSPFFYSVLRNKMIEFNEMFDLIVYYIPSFDVMGTVMTGKSFNPICLYNKRDDCIYIFFGNVFILPVDKKTRKTVCFDDKIDEDVYDDLRNLMTKSSKMLVNKDSGKKEVYLQDNIPMRQGTNAVKKFRKDVIKLTNILDGCGYMSYGAFPISAKGRACYPRGALGRTYMEIRQCIKSAAYMPELRTLIPKSMKEIRKIRNRRYHREYYTNRMLKALRENQSSQRELVKGLVVLARLCGVRFDLLEGNYELCRDTVFSEDMIYYFSIALKKKFELFEGQVDDETFDTLSAYMSNVSRFIEGLDSCFRTYQNYVLAISCAIPRLKYVFDKRMEEVKREIFEEEVRKDKERNRNLWRNCSTTKKPIYSF